MFLLTCAALRRQLAAFYDGELSIEEQIAIEVHLDGCPPCAREARELRLIGEALRHGSERRRLDEEMAGLQARVLGRVRAERYESLQACLGRMFEDLHLVWAGLGATAAAVLCVAATVAILNFASLPGRADSLAGLLSVLASPGSNENPVRPGPALTLPRASLEALMPVALHAPTADDDVVFALSGVITREGRLTDVALLRATGSPQHEVRRLLRAAASTRFEPASLAGHPVAVNMVWLVARTTVRGKLDS